MSKQDTAHYYLVNIHSELNSSPLGPARMIFRDFRKIETLLEGTTDSLTICKIPCADFDNQGMTFDDFKIAQDQHRESKADDMTRVDNSVPVRSENSVSASKIDFADEYCKR